MNKRLTDYASNTYSQFGEDGMLAEVLKRLRVERGICVEFGAWDGVYHANTAKLWKEHGWKAVLIEADGERFKTLLEKTKDHDCICLNEMVANEGEHSLEAILARENIAHVDVLSIDIDGDDWYVFDSLKTLKPRVILCEYNPTMPPEVSLVGESGSRFGCSARALTELAERKGYALVGMTDTNGIYVRKEDAGAFADLECLFEAIALRKHNTYLITTYDGDYVLSKKPAFGMRIAARAGLPPDRVLYVQEQRHPLYWLRRWMGSLRRGSKNT